MKTEDGEKYPASAFAYVPDIEKASAWKLRLWEDPEKKVTRAQLGRAAAALSPGGFKGQKVTIPSADMSAVKRKIRNGKIFKNFKYISRIRKLNSRRKKGTIYY